MFSTSALNEKLGICLHLAMFIGDDWMFDRMVIYIEKTIAQSFGY